MIKYVIVVGEQKDGTPTIDKLEGLTEEEWNMVLDLIRKHIEEMRVMPGYMSVYKAKLAKWISIICRLDI